MFFSFYRDFVSFHFRVLFSLPVKFTVSYSQSVSTKFKRDLQLRTFFGENFSQKSNLISHFFRLDAMEKGVHVDHFCETFLRVNIEGERMGIERTKQYIYPPQKFLLSAAAILKPSKSCLYSFNHQAGRDC